MKLKIIIDENDLKNIKKYKSKKGQDNLIEQIKDDVAEKYFPGLSLEIDSGGAKFTALPDWTMEELIHQKVIAGINASPGIIWCPTEIDDVEHWLGYAKNGICYAAAKFLNHAEQQDKYIVVRREAVPESDLVTPNEKLTTFLSADVKKYLTSNSLGVNFKDKQIDYKVSSYSHWERRAVQTDIVNSDALHAHMHNERFNIFSVCTYENLEEVKRACAQDLKNIFSKDQITWREFIKGPTGSFVTGELKFLSKKSPMYMIDIEDDNSFTVALVKSDYETVIKSLGKSLPDGGAALKLCEADLQNSQAQNNEAGK